MTTIQVNSFFSRCLSYPRKFAYASVLGLAAISGCTSNDVQNIPVTRELQGQDIKDDIPDKNGLFLASVDQALVKAKLNKIKNVKLWLTTENKSNTAYYEFILNSGGSVYLLLPNDLKEVQRLEDGLRTANNEPLYITKGEKSGSEKIIDKGLMLAPSVVAILLITSMLLYYKKLTMGRGKDWKPVKSTTKFSDVRGYPQLVERMKNIVKYVRDKDKNNVGAILPKGILLIGPPGTGKTLLARAIAGEAGVPFVAINGADFMKTPFAGVATARVENLFKKFKKGILFIDEIDAIGAKRTNSGTDVGREHTQVMNKLLERMDGFTRNSEVVILAATNRPEVLDPALTRPGRFDMTIEVPRPYSSKQRLDILDKYLEIKKKEGKLGPDVDMKLLAEHTEGFVGADLENLVNRAALIAFENNKPLISMDEFLDASREIALGIENNDVISEADLWKDGVHEVGGHLITGLVCGKKLDSVSMVPRGKSLGHVRFTGGQDSEVLHSKKKLFEKLVYLLGGRAAEITLLPKDEETTGAHDDYKQARKIIRVMLGSAMFEGHNTNDYSDENMELTEKDGALMSKLLDNVLKTDLKIIEDVIKQVSEDNVKALIRDFIEAGELNGVEAETLCNKYLSGVDWNALYKSYVDSHSLAPASVENNLMAL